MTEFRRLLLGVFVGWLLAVTASAAIASACFASSARRLLKVHFLFAFHHPLSEAASIWLTNSRASLGVSGCVLAIAFMERIAPARRRRDRLPFWLCDLILVVMAVRTAALAGLLIGAYGTMQLHAFLPDGPVELLAWALLGCIYIQVRRRRIGLRDCAIGLVVVELLLVIAALLEALL
ncbi:MAG TPA: hypothetical protein VGL78_04330 [Solirubrobacteraceae bacterium]|jgi:hypothetical protein